MIRKKQDQIVFTGVDALDAVRKGEKLLVDGRAKKVTDLTCQKGDEENVRVKASIRGGKDIERVDTGEYLTGTGGERDVKLRLSEDEAPERIVESRCTSRMVTWYVSSETAGKEPEVFLSGDDNEATEVYEMGGYYFVYSAREEPDVAYQTPEGLKDYVYDRVTEDGLTMKDDDLDLFKDSDRLSKIVATVI